jgi:hypothetical protein
MQNRAKQITLGARPEARPMWLWLLMAGDVMVLVWMKIFGAWLDGFSQLTSVATLGGHHIVVMVLAALGFGILAVLAVPTAGFTMATPAQLVIVAVACIASIVALAGFVSFLIAAVFGRFVFGPFLR